MTLRPFRILGIQQVTMGGSRKEKLRTLWGGAVRFAHSGRSLCQAGRSVSPATHACPLIQT